MNVNFVKAKPIHANHQIIETACHLFLHCDCATQMQQNLIKLFFSVSLLDAVVFARRSLENFGLDDFP